MEKSSDGPKMQQIRSEVSGFNLRDLTGSPRTLRGELEGKKGAVVVFWSCVCSHCMRYDDYLNGFAARHPEIQLLAVASRQQETASELAAAASQRRLNFPILLDTGGAVAEQWFVQQTPRAFLIGAGLTLEYRGAIDNFQYPDDPGYIAYLEPAIADLLAGRPVAQPETPSFGCAIRSVYYQLQKII